MSNRKAFFGGVFFFLLLSLMIAATDKSVYDQAKFQAFLTKITGVLNFDSNTLVVDATNNRVGIGTAAPNARLHVQGIDNAYPVRVYGGSTLGQSYGHIVYAGTNATDSALNIRNYADNTQLLYVQGDGKVGIGTASPNGALDVVVSGGNSIINARYSADSSGPNFTAFKSRGTMASPSIVNSGDVLAEFSAYGNDGSSWDKSASITMEVDAAPSAGTDMPGRIVFKTSADGSATPGERMRIGSGKVGIGVSDFSTSIAGDYSPLHVSSGVATYWGATFGATRWESSGAFDTGISINAGSGGGSVLLNVSRNSGTGTNVDIAIYAIRLYYDGSNTPTKHYIGGSSDFITVGKSGSNTLTISDGTSSNKSVAWFLNKN